MVCLNFRQGGKTAGLHGTSLFNRVIPRPSGLLQFKVQLYAFIDVLLTRARVVVLSRPDSKWRQGSRRLAHRAPVRKSCCLVYGPDRCRDRELPDCVDDALPNRHAGKIGIRR
jgi:hypothetical protein